MAKGRKRRNRKKKQQQSDDSAAELPAPSEPEDGFDGFATKKKKKKNKFTGFMDEGEASPVSYSDDSSSDNRSKRKKKKGKGKGKKKGKGKGKFMDDKYEDELENDRLMMEKMRREEAIKKAEAKRQQAARKKKQPKKKMTGFAAAALLMGDSSSDEQQPSSSPEPSPEPVKEPTPAPKTPTPPPQPRGKKGKKGRRKKKGKKKDEDDDWAALAELTGATPKASEPTSEKTSPSKTEETKSPAAEPAEEKAPATEAVTVPQWIANMDEDDFDILVSLFKKAKNKGMDQKKAIKKPMMMIDDLEDEPEKAIEAWELFNKGQLMQKAPTPKPAAPKIDPKKTAQQLKKKRKNEEKKRRDKCKKLKPKVEKARDRLISIKNTFLASFPDDLRDFLDDEDNPVTVLRVDGELKVAEVPTGEDPEQGERVNYRDMMIEFVDPFVEEIKTAVAELEPAVKIHDEGNKTWKDAEAKANNMSFGGSWFKETEKRVGDFWESLVGKIIKTKEAYEERLEKEREEAERKQKEAEEEKRRLKAEKRKNARKNKGKGKKLDAKTLAMMQQMGIDPNAAPPSKKRGGGRNKRKGKGRKSKAQLEKERLDAEAKRVEEERRKQKEEEERQARLKAEEERKAREAAEAEAKRIEAEKAARRKARAERKAAEESSDHFGDSSDGQGEFSDEDWDTPEAAKMADSNAEFSDGEFDEFGSDFSDGPKAAAKDEWNDDSESDEPAPAPVKKQKPVVEETKEETPPSPKEEAKEEIREPTPEPQPKKKGKKGKGKNKKKGKGKKSKEDKKKEKEEKRKKRLENLRAPIGCIMGHVDAGKTLILDNIRRSKVQAGEAGGITQQIGATFLPKERLASYLLSCRKGFKDLEFHLPGVLMIDTPGHEAFTNMRQRGSSLCDIAILAVNYKDANRERLQPQTIESLNLLQQLGSKTPFVIAMNQIDLVYGWKTPTDKKGNKIGGSIVDSLAIQDKSALGEVDTALSKLKVLFGNEGYNTELFTENKHKKTDISIVPCSAMTGEGIPDLMCLLAELTQKYMTKGLQFVSDEVTAAVLEVKKMEGIGNVMDVILANGELRRDDEIIMSGLDGPIHTPIRALMLPNAAQEMRVKGQYKNVESVMAACGVRISGHGLEKAMAGSSIIVVPRGLKKADKEMAIEDIKDQVMADYGSMIHKYVDKSGVGIHVQANTLGALEALLSFICKEMKVPVKSIRIGAISKKDIMTAMTAHDHGHPEYACILSFMVDCPRDVALYAEQNKVQVFRSEIIYHLQDMFEKYLEEEKSRRRTENKEAAIFPVMLRIMPDHVIRKSNPIILGCEVVKGLLKLGTPLAWMCLGKGNIPAPLHVGIVDGIQDNQKEVEEAKMGDKVAVRIQIDGPVNLLYGRQFNEKWPLVSEITRNSLDKLKELYLEDLKDDRKMFNLILELKRYFQIQ